MKHPPFKELKISRFGIGTVQFGLDYGINNKTGQVSYSDVLNIFETALENGVNFLDTSRVYGTSEETIGKALREIGAVDDFIPCTKLDISENYHEKSDEAVRGEVNGSLRQSLEALGIETIPVYLLHRPEYRTFRDGLIWDYLKEAVTKGMIGRLGVSIADGPSEAIECFKDPAVEAIQIPYNVFDARWDKAGILAGAAERGIVVFNRSSYLKGLLLMEMDEVPEHVTESLCYKESLNQIAAEAGLDVKELVLRYVFSVPEITSTIIGIDSQVQFKENVRIYEKGPLEDALNQRIKATFWDIPEYVLNPFLWDQRLLMLQ
ncbi:MAG: aldo/keto reductase, partial [Candidatus Latescibacteria bacterium]|nr:aldo/keto reductase [Candidatus Latescibacterota bacterium]